MQVDPEITEYLKKLPSDYSHIIDQIRRTSSHQLHFAIIRNLIHISVEEIITHNKDRIDYLAQIYHTLISEMRINELNRCIIRPSPYNSINLLHLPVLDNHLTHINNFKFFNYGFQFNNKVYNLALTTDNIYPSIRLSECLWRLYSEEKLNFKIRLDPFIECDPYDYLPSLPLMSIYGKQLNWEKLKTLNKIDDGKWMNDNQFENSDFTEYVWNPTTNEIHFTCEELPKEDSLTLRGSRYFHAIFDKNTGKVNHCDGAIRYFTKEDLTLRKKFHLKNPEVTKIGKRVKIFQIDESISQSAFAQLATNFFVGNNDVLKYFN